MSGFPRMDCVLDPEDYFAVISAMHEKARNKRIELLSFESSDKFGPFRDIYHKTPVGHYVNFRIHRVQIVAVGCFQHGAGFYEDLIPGYKLSRIVKMIVVPCGVPAPGASDEEVERYYHDPATCEALKPGRFMSIEYIFSPGLTQVDRAP